MNMLYSAYFFVKCSSRVIFSFQVWSIWILSDFWDKCNVSWHCLQVLLMSFHWLSIYMKHFSRAIDLDFGFQWIWEHTNRDKTIIVPHSFSFQWCAFAPPQKHKLNMHVMWFLWNGMCLILKSVKQNLCCSPGSFLYN